jgi:hypothetical protein
MLQMPSLGSQPLDYSGRFWVALPKGIARAGPAGGPIRSRMGFAVCEAKRDVGGVRCHRDRIESRRADRRRTARRLCSATPTLREVVPPAARRQFLRRYAGRKPSISLLSLAPGLNRRPSELRFPPIIRPFWFLSDCVYFQIRPNNYKDARPMRR